MLIPVGFKFHEDIPPKEVPPQVTLDQRLQELQSKDNELYSAVFGKGLTKGKKEVTADHLQVAKDERYEKAKAALTKERVTRAILEKAAAKGFFVPDDAVELLQGSLALNDEMEIISSSTGEKMDIDAVVDSLAKRKNHLIRSKQKPGIGGNPPVEVHDSRNPDKPVFKRSQLREHAFYMAHEAEIMDAARNNRIVND